MMFGTKHKIENPEVVKAVRERLREVEALRQSIHDISRRAHDLDKQAWDLIEEYFRGIGVSLDSDRRLYRVLLAEGVVEDGGPADPDSLYKYRGDDA